MPSTKNKPKSTSKGKPKSPPVNKSKFVKSQPHSMSAKEVVAAAKAHGISLREKYVYNVRAKAKARAAKGAKKPQASRAAVSAPAAVKAPPMPSTAAKKVNKSAFVRSLPTSMTAKEVVAKAKAQGISLSVPLVYIARRKSKPTAAKRAPRRLRKTAAAATVSSVESSSVENLLRAAAAEIGLSRAMAILGEQRDAVRAVLGG